MLPLTPLHRPRGDIVLAVVVTVIAVGGLSVLPALSAVDPELAVPGPTQWQWWITLFSLVGQGLLLAWTSAAPERLLIAVAAVALALSTVAPGEASSIAFLAVIPAAYVAVRRHPATTVWTPLGVAAALTAAAGAVANLRQGDAGVAASLSAAAGQSLLVLGLPAIAGWVAAARAESRASRQREAVARANEMEARAEAAVAAERTAIARELHDIAAHHLSGIALMSSAISQQIDTDPETAKAGLADVRTQTRELLNELRGLVALLRQDDGAAVEVASLAGLDALVADATVRGLDVSLAISSGMSLQELARGIGPLGQFAAYRTVQEALANAARHAPDARCTVQLRDAGAVLEIVVVNGPDAAGTPEYGATGFGLRGMEERAALTRSTLVYGQTEDGGWRVQLRVPREPGHADTPSGGLL